MVWALAAVAATALASAGVQWLNSNKALNASEAEREKMRRLINKVQDPNFDSSAILPEDLELVGNYIPEATSYIEEIAPKAVKAQSAGAVAGRQAQLNALSQFKRLVQQGMDPQTAIEMAKAQRGMAAEGASARATAQAQAQSRGFGGGQSFYEAGADQAGMDRMAMLQQQALADAANRRMQATGQMAALGGQIRGEDVSLEQANVNAINAFNQRMAARKQDWATQQAGMRNDAQRYNLGERQRISDTNKTNDYNAAVRNQNNRNTNAQNQFANAMSRVSGQNTISQQAQQGYMDRAAQDNKTLQSVTDLGGKVAMEKYKYDTDMENEAARLAFEKYKYDNDPLRKG